MDDVVSTVIVITAAIALWLAAAVIVGILIGGMIRRRDR